MTAAVFEEFKPISQSEYAINFAAVENVDVEEGLKNVSEQFARMITSGLQTEGQRFFEVFERTSNESTGYLWLGVQGT